MGLGPWAEEQTQLPFTISPCFVFGRWEHIWEQYRPDRVQRQFGWPQDVQSEATWYWRATKELTTMFGLALDRGSLHQAWRDLSAVDWDWRGGMEDAGSTQAYRDAFRRPRPVGRALGGRAAVRAGEIARAARRGRYEARGVRRAAGQAEGDRP